MPIEQSECSRIFLELEGQRTDILAELSKWPSSRLGFRPAPGAWSAVEVVDHIVRAEAGTIEDIRTGLQNPHFLNNKPRPRVAALDRALRSDQAFHVPPGAAEIHPDAQATLPDVASRWAHARTELGSLLRTLTPAQAEFGVFRHPFAGWMTVADVLKHFSAHLYHHGFQLARLRVSSAGLQSDLASAGISDKSTE